MIIRQTHIQEKININFHKHKLDQATLIVELLQFTPNHEKVEKALAHGVIGVSQRAK